MLASRSKTDDLARIFPGGSELARLMRDFDWTATALGDPTDWPDGLKTALRIILASSQPFWIGWGDDLIYFYNDPYKSIIGGKHPRALGQPTRVVWREIWPTIQPQLAQAMKGEEGIYVESKFLIMERNGYREEVYYTYSYSPILDSNGQADGMICANTDDTQRVIGQRQLALLHELAAHIADAQTGVEAARRCAGAMESNPRDLPFALIYLPDGPDVTTFSLAGAAGIEPGQIAAPQRVEPGSAAPWPLHEALESSQITVIENLSSISPAPLPTGVWDVPPANAALVPIGGATAAQRGVLVVGLNPCRLFDEDYRNFLLLLAGQIAAGFAAAEAHEAERDRARQLQQTLDDSVRTARMKDEFLATLSHELRTPMSAILGWAQLLRHSTDGEDMQEGIEVIERNARLQSQIIEDMLDMNRILAGKMRLEIQSVSIGKIVESAVQSILPAARAKGLELTCRCAPGIPEIRGDSNRLQQVIYNLLTNAVKFTPAEGNVQVDCRRADSHVQISVSDTGRGISPAFLPFVFERFRQQDPTITRSFGGLGLGLAICKQLVELHGGAISAQSKGEDQGATFTVRLPTTPALLPEHPADAPVHSPARQLMGQSSSKVDNTSASDVSAIRGRSILVVDDEPDARAMIRKVLEDRGAHCAAAASGQEALDLLRTQASGRVDLLISDLGMPGMHGYELMEHIRQLPPERGGAMPAIALTAFARPEDRARSLRSGFQVHLAKPVEIIELLSSIVSLIG